MSGELTQSAVVSERLKVAITDLKALQGLLLLGDLDACVLTDFRDALNRVRNAAWAAHQSVAAQLSGEGPNAVVSLLAAARIRAAYQLCRAIQGDLGCNEIDFQKGQLSELRGAAVDLAAQLKDRV